MEMNCWPAFFAQVKGHKQQTLIQYKGGQEPAVQGEVSSFEQWSLHLREMGGFQVLLKLIPMWTHALNLLLENKISFI